jgi:hypothetical protein
MADDIEAGRLRPGDRLPTQRALAHALGVNLTTITRALNEAHRRGLIVASAGRGTFIRARPLAAGGVPPRIDPSSFRSMIDLPPQARGAEPTGAETFLTGLENATQPGHHRHVCLFFRDPAEQWASFRHYLLAHCRAGLPTTYAYHSSNPEQIRDRLQREGLDPQHFVDAGLLRIVPAHESYLLPGRFSAEFMASYVELLAKRMRLEGFNRWLFTGEMDWYFSGAKGVEEIHAYESRLNRLLDDYPEITIVCQYDISRFDAASSLEACCTHPFVHMKAGLWRGFYRPE